MISRPEPLFTDHACAAGVIQPSPTLLTHHERSGLILPLNPPRSLSQTGSSILYIQLLSPLLIEEMTSALTSTPATLENIFSAKPSEQ